MFDLLELMIEIYYPSKQSLSLALCNEEIKQWICYWVIYFALYTIETFSIILPTYVLFINKIKKKSIKNEFSSSIYRFLKLLFCLWLILPKFQVNRQ